MKCPKCGKTMYSGYTDVLNFGLTKPIWMCSDYKNCKYEMPKEKRVG